MIKVMFGGPGDRNVLWEPRSGASPATVAREAFESDRRHSLVAKQMQGLRRYAINRGFDGQPSLTGAGRVPTRIAELWWDTVADVEECFNSPSGLADLGDTSVRLPWADINYPKFKAGPVTFLDETALPVANPLAFDLMRGQYVGGEPVVKAYGFVSANDLEVFDDWYVRFGSTLVEQVPEIRAHVYESRVHQTIHIGNIVWGEQVAADRVINFWFSSAADIEHATSTTSGQRLFAEIDSHVSSVEWISMRNQEIFRSINLHEAIYGL